MPYGHRNTYMMDKLTDKQKMFVLEYIQDCNGMQAAIRAGYSRKSAKKSAEMNMKNPLVREEIQKKLQEIESSKIASSKEIMEFWTKVMRGETTEQTLMYVERGIQSIVDIKSGTNSRIKASENLAKVQGMFLERNSEDEDNISKLDELLSKIDSLAEEKDDEA